MDLDAEQHKLVPNPHPKWAGGAAWPSTDEGVDEGKCRSLGVHWCGGATIPRQLGHEKLKPRPLSRNSSESERAAASQPEAARTGWMRTDRSDVRAASTRRCPSGSRVTAPSSSSACARLASLPPCRAQHSTSAARGCESVCCLQGGRWTGIVAGKRARPTGRADCSSPLRCSAVRRGARPHPAARNPSMRASAQEGPAPQPRETPQRNAAACRGRHGRRRGTGAV